jgi:CheY-like chemotaxis protein
MLKAIAAEQAHAEPLPAEVEGPAVASVEPREAKVAEPVIEIWAKVLLVEDNPVNQKVAKKLLSNLGCDVTVANDGAEAIDLDLNQFDIVFMDMQMPRLDGLSATRQIRHKEQRTGDHALIVALTANAMEEDRTNCMDAGMDDYMPKPLRQAALEEMLHKHLKPIARVA